MGDDWRTEIAESPQAITQPWDPTVTYWASQGPFALLTAFLVWFITQDLKRSLDGIHKCLDELKDEIRKVKP